MESNLSKLQKNLKDEQNICLWKESEKKLFIKIRKSLILFFHQEGVKEKPSDTDSLPVADIYVGIIPTKLNENTETMIVENLKFTIF